MIHILQIFLLEHKAKSKQDCHSHIINREWASNQFEDLCGIYFPNTTKKLLVSGGFSLNPEVMQSLYLKNLLSNMKQVSLVIILSKLQQLSVGNLGSLSLSSCKLSTKVLLCLFEHLQITISFWNSSTYVQA